MIKNRSNTPAMKTPQQPPSVLNQISIPGDVIMQDYILKEIQNSGTVEQVKLKLAEKLSEASRAGYRYLDRVPANSTESILIFCKVDK